MCAELSVYTEAQQLAASSGSRWQCSRLTLTLTRLGRAAPGSGQGMPELVRTCTGASADAGAGKGSWDSVRCKRGSHVVAKARRRRGVGRRWRAARWALQEADASHVEETDACMALNLNSSQRSLLQAQLRLGCMLQLNRRLHVKCLSCRCNRLFSASY